MKALLSPGSVEPLESRIAPAVIFTGGTGAGEDVAYNEAPFVNTLAGADQISKVVGPDPNVYYLRLETGDVLLNDAGAGYVNFISGLNGAPLKGSLVAIFTDDGDGRVEQDELTGLALGNGVSVQVSGTVNGDVVSNYNDETGTLGGDAEAGGATATDLLMNSITAFSANGVTGNLISGGEIKSVKITNEVGEIRTGRAANGVAYDFNGALPDGGDTLTVANVAGQKGVKISNVVAGSVTRIEAGAGGAGAVGGDITNVTLISDLNGFAIKAGNGGDGAGTKTSGGNGGKIVNVLINGLDENVLDPTSDTSTIEAGDGGAGIGTGKGGLGGDVTKVSFGYEQQGTKVNRSASTLADEVLVRSGNGGAGKLGGNGGKLTDVRVFANPTAAGSDIDIFSGNGGDNLVAGGKAGAGGLISDVTALNSNPSAQMSFINIDGGDGGSTAVGGGAGNAGALINGVFAAGFGVRITGGNGSDGGSAGGIGGDVRSVEISGDFFEGVRPERVIIDGGSGGNGSVGKGNKGGSIVNLTVLNAQLTQFDINQTAGAAEGGSSAKGIGGEGGSVSGLTISDLQDFAVVPAFSTTIQIKTGIGGNGGGGGKGGSLTGANSFDVHEANLALVAGNGGTATLKGAGGAGGSIGNLAFFTDGTVGGVSASVTATAGFGGAGNDSGAGGVGGSVAKVHFRAPGTITLDSGAGGAGGANGAAGAGGNVSSFVGRSFASSVDVEAGDAGATGIKAGAGGGITVANLLASTTITVTAGDGRAGGAGGSLKEIGFSDVSLVAGSSGAVTLTAGAGSGAGKAAGNGGSIIGAAGYIGTSGLSSFTAGVGGGVATKAAAGGSIQDLSIKGGGGVGAELRIQAGDAADVAGAKTGGLGGSVRAVGVETLEADTIFRRVAAGDGGDTGAGKGGLGGTIDNVRANATIGVRSGEGFGFDTMGGLFAGSGGAGNVLNGLAGNVTNVGADAIASIVAGKPVTGSLITERNMVQRVANITLNGQIESTVDDNGTFVNFAVANVIGGVVNPTDPGVPYDPDNDPATPPVMHPHANTFDLMNAEFVDTNPGGVPGEFGIGDTITAKTDGFIAALSIDLSAFNVQPEAVLTASSTGAIEFIDLNNTNGQKIAP